jgi:alkane 1-monooxygenase
LIGESRWPSENALKNLSEAKERGYEAALYSAIIATVALLGWGLWVAASWPLSGWEFAGLAISVGVMTGYVGITVAHELMHRASLADQALGWALMVAALYPHYPVEHVHGHHHRIATPEDPATARRGESFYAFLLRTIVTGLASAIRLRPLPVLSMYAALAAVLFGIYFGMGPQAFAFILIQGIVAVLMLEGVQYQQHYGLLRARRPDGHYEPAGPAHSWNTSSFVTNTNTFNLGRHADHHCYSRRRYYRLRHVEGAPQQPFGYAAMFLIALVPPLWFRIVDPRLDAWLAHSGHGADARDAGRGAFANQA